MPFSQFDFTLLKHADFKEDSVREELISPLLKILGYSASGPNRIVRSKSLTHPFVYIGTKKNEVKIVPDYLLEINGKCGWILDAKGPRENIRSGKNVEQAFSYAIHPEVRALLYALCNGQELIVFSINKIEPVLIVPLQEIASRLDAVKMTLSPLAFTNPSLLQYRPDFGLYCRKIGISNSVTQYFYGIGLPSITKVNETLYTAFLNIKSGDDWYALSLDFNNARYRQLLNVVNSNIAKRIRDALSMQPFQIDFGEDAPQINVSARVGHKIHMNASELYCPLVVEKFEPL